MSEQSRITGKIIVIARNREIINRAATLEPYFENFRPISISKYDFVTDLQILRLKPLVVIRD